MKTAGRSCTMLQKVMLPHVMFANIFHYYKDAWSTRVCDSLNRLASFWDAMAGTPLLADHPVTRIDGYSRRAVPISLHHDGVPVVGCGKAWGKTATIYSWASMLGRGATQQCNFLTWFCYDACMSKSFNLDTQNSFWKVLTWSLYWLYRGQWPDRNWDGIMYTAADGQNFIRRLQPLAEGMCGVVWAAKQDLEALWKELKLQNCNSNDPCIFCPATSNADVRGPGRRRIAGLPMLEFRMEKAFETWIPQTYSKAAFALSNKRTHLLFLNVPGVTVLTVKADVMHCKHMGCDFYFMASVLVLLCFEVMPDSPEDNCIAVWTDIKQLYKELRSSCRLTNMKIPMFCIGYHPSEAGAAMPKLKIRANQARHLNAVMARVWSKYYNADDVHHVMILMAMQASCRTEQILDDNADSFRWPEEVADEYIDQTFQYLMLFSALGSHYNGIGWLLFDVTVKTHYLAHAALHSRWLNPRLGWCYGGEDFMHRMQRPISACSAGNQPAKLVHKVMDRYRYAIHLELSGVSGLRGMR